MSEIHYITRTCQGCGGPLSMANECGTGESLVFRCPRCDILTQANPPPEGKKTNMQIKCKCGAELTVADPGQGTCPGPGCDMIYNVSNSHVKWHVKWSGSPEWITLPAASQRFNVPLPTLRYHAIRQHFEAYKPDRRTWLCEAGSVEEWVKGRRK